MASSSFVLWQRSVADEAPSILGGSPVPASPADPSRAELDRRGAGQHGLTRPHRALGLCWFLMAAIGRHRKWGLTTEMSGPAT